VTLSAGYVGVELHSSLFHELTNTTNVGGRQTHWRSPTPIIGGTCAPPPESLPMFVLTSLYTYRWHCMYSIGPTQACLNEQPMHGMHDVLPPRSLYYKPSSHRTRESLLNSSTTELGLWSSQLAPTVKIEVSS